jgi:hypothetical protein
VPRRNFAARKPENDVPILCPVAPVGYVARPGPVSTRFFPKNPVMHKAYLLSTYLILCTLAATGQQLTLGKQRFDLKNVTGSIIDFQGAKVLKIERDLTALPFDVTRLGSTVDENGAKYSTFIVSKMLGSTKRGSIGLWVDIGTIGYFKGLIVTKRR